MVIVQTLLLYKNESGARAVRLTPNRNVYIDRVHTLTWRMKMVFTPYQIQKMVREEYDMARTKFPHLSPKPTFKLKVRDTVKKLGHWARYKNELMVSKNVQRESDLRDIIKHELGHFIVDECGLMTDFERLIDDAHGQKWKDVVRCLGGSAAPRHNLKMGDGLRDKTKYAFTCPSGCEIKKTRMCGVVRNPERYRCKSHGQQLQRIK